MKSAAAPIPERSPVISANSTLLPNAVALNAAATYTAKTAAAPAFTRQRVSSKESRSTLDAELNKNFNMEIRNMPTSGEKSERHKAKYCRSRGI